MKRTALADYIVLNLGHARTSMAWSNCDISSPFMRLFYVRKGSACFHLPQGDVMLSGGHMYMLPPYMPHSYDCGPDCDFFYLFVYHQSPTAINSYDMYNFPIEVDADNAIDLLFDNYCSLYPQLHLPTRAAEDFVNHQAYRDYALAYMSMPLYKRMQLHGLVAILFSYFMRHATPRAEVCDHRVLHVIDYVQENICQPLTVETLAAVVCMSPLNLIRTFRRNMGVTPLQYVLRKKVQHAQSLLLSTQMPVSAIAAAAGFNDVSYFIRIFKKKLGFTPQEYRERLIG